MDRRIKSGDDDLVGWSLYHPPPPRPPPPPPDPPENPDELDELLGIELDIALVALDTAEAIERPKLSLDQLPPRRQRVW